MLKKVAFILFILILGSSTIYAEKIKTLSTSNITRVEILINQNGDIDYTASLQITGIILDSNGDLFQGEGYTISIGDLEQNVKNQLDNLLKQFSRDFNNRMVAEDSETLPDPR